ncbi:hypothetical protein [Microbacterium phyllosphaerae]|uniref:hypothetical protein n=1 Tax=Microbacterium phyllosphaerae TaxID=124798 RepID=UPI003D64D05A
MTLERVVGLVGDLDRSKRMAVGTGCAPFPQATFGAKKVSFTDAVTAVWTWYTEKLRHDLQFLTARAEYAQKATLHAFVTLLDDQRHVNEHADFNRASEALAWRAAVPTDAEVPSDDDMLDALLDELITALETLKAIAARVGQSNSGPAEWRTHEAHTPESEIRAVLADIGRDGLPQRRVETVVRRFVGHYKLKTALTQLDRTKIAAVVAMEMNLDPLSIPHSDILDEFSLIGDPRGFALLLVAHGAESAGFTGSRLLPALRRAWSGMHSSNPLKPPV